MIKNFPSLTKNLAKFHGIYLYPSIEFNSLELFLKKAYMGWQFNPLTSILSNKGNYALYVCLTIVFISFLLNK